MDTNTIQFSSAYLREYVDAITCMHEALIDDIEMTSEFVEDDFLNWDDSLLDEWDDDDSLWVRR